MYKAASLPSQFEAAPVANVQRIDLSRLATFATSNESIDVGDVVQVTIASGFGNQPPQSYPVRVADDGTANIELVGPVRLAGLELEDAEAVIRAAAIERGQFRQPYVTVTMHKQRVNSVTVIGAVENPGQYNLPRANSSLLNALVAAGGLSADAGTEVQIRRPGSSRSYLRQRAPQQENVAGVPVQQAAYAPPQMAATGPTSIHVDLVSATEQGGAAHRLDDGDVVMVLPRNPKPIQVIGLVKKPGQYELPINQELRVLDALAMAGGRSVPWAQKVYVIRRVPGRAEPVVIQVNVHRAKRSFEWNTRLAEGDIVSVEQTPVTLVMSTLNFVRLGVGASVPLF